jgi:hypothetical protein
MPASPRPSSVSDAGSGMAASSRWRALSFTSRNAARPLDRRFEHSSDVRVHSKDDHSGRRRTTIRHRLRPLRLTSPLLCRRGTGVENEHTQLRPWHARPPRECARRSRWRRSWKRGFIASNLLDRVSRRRCATAHPHTRVVAWHWSLQPVGIAPTRPGPRHLAPRFPSANTWHNAERGHSATLRRTVLGRHTGPSRAIRSRFHRSADMSSHVSSV